MPPHTITDPEKFKEGLRQIRSERYALDDEEFSQGLMGVASPIFNYSRKIMGAISISGPSQRLQEKSLESLTKLVKSAAQQISQRLGYNGAKSIPGGA